MLQSTPPCARAGSGSLPAGPAGPPALPIKNGSARQRGKPLPRFAMLCVCSGTFRFDFRFDEAPLEPRLARRSRDGRSVAAPAPLVRSSGSRGNRPWPGQREAYGGTMPSASALHYGLGEFHSCHVVLGAGRSPALISKRAARAGRTAVQGRSGWGQASIESRPGGSRCSPKSRARFLRNIGRRHVRPRPMLGCGPHTRTRLLKHRASIRIHQFGVHVEETC